MPHPLHIARTTAIALSLAAGVAAPPAMAAKIETAVTPDMAELGCTLRLSGGIGPGDLAALSAVLAEPPQMEALGGQLPFSPAQLYGFPFGTHRLCLNSPGGDVDTALDIAEALDQFADEYGLRGIPTAVASGDRCDGACGLIFMAGRHSWQSFSASYWRQDRILHPQGHLSLPARALSDTPDPRRTVARLTRLIAQEAIGISPGLLAEMLATDAPEALPVDTVGAASRYGIEVAPLAMASVLATPLDTLRANACANAAEMVRGRFTIAPPPETPQDWILRPVNYDDLNRTIDFLGSPGGYMGTASVFSEPNEYSCAMISTFLSTGIHESLGDDPAVHEEGYFAMRGGGYGVAGFVDGVQPGDAINPYEPDLVPDIGPVDIGPLQLHAPETPLSEL